MQAISNNIACRTVISGYMLSADVQCCMFQRGEDTCIMHSLSISYLLPEHPRRNQHMIKTTLPTSFDYISPIDPPGGLEPPNFVPQFECEYNGLMRSESTCVIFYDLLGTGTIDMVPYLSVTPGQFIQVRTTCRPSADKYMPCST